MSINHDSSRNSSSSSNTSTTTTNTYDQRVSAGNNGTAVSASNSNVQVIDGGAIRLADMAGVRLAQLATDSVNKTSVMATHYADNLKEAYTESKAGEQKIMAVAALAIVGTVAAKSFGK